MVAFSGTPGARSRSPFAPAGTTAGARAAAEAGWSDLPAGWRNLGAAAAKLRLPSRRRGGARRSLLFPPQSEVLYTDTDAITQSLPQRVSIHDLRTSTRSGPLPSRRSLPGFSLLFFPCRAGAVFARRGGRGPSGMSAPRGTQWNGRGRAEQPRVCRERGGGEAPGTSMSRIHIYTLMIAGAAALLPSRAGTCKERLAGATTRGQAPSGVEGLWAYWCDAAECGWGTL